MDLYSSRNSVPLRGIPYAVMHHRSIPSIPVSIWIFLLTNLLISECWGFEDRYCRSLDIRNNPGMAYHDIDTRDRWATVRNCTVMEGDLSISMITSTNFTHESFPTLDNLRVITGHLFVFQVSVLRSLKRMLPNLRIIGGQALIMNYALVIYQNSHLIEVGLPKLTTIINGGVRIMDNLQLCYSRYIDWKAILVGPVNDILVDESRSPDSDSCTNECATTDKDRCHKVDNVLSCWDAETCQMQCSYTKNDDGTIGPGCDNFGQKCHEQCIGGCAEPNNASACYYCKNMLHRGTCIEKCPQGLYEIHHVYLIRRCVTIEECKNISAPITEEHMQRRMLIVDNQCRVDCPAGQQIDPNDPFRCKKCEGYCPVKCKGGTLDYYQRINDYRVRKCNVIEGSLEIELRAGLDAAAMEKLGEALSTIEVIEDFLLIDFSVSFVSLNMFKRLRLIKGNRKWRDRYALAVFENPNLRQVFNFERQPLKILNGTVMFQNNRMLCHNRIQSLINHLGLNDVTDNDVSPYSNGDRAICVETTFEVNVTEVQSNLFVINWVAFNTTDMDHRKFLGYQIFYKKVDYPNPNMSIDDDRSACSDSWTMQFEPDQTNGKEEASRGTGTVIYNLAPNTWYAYYVQTKMINHPGAKNAISKINFNKTYFAIPDPPKEIRGKSRKPDQIEVEWDSPERPHGEITHYMIKWRVDDGESIVKPDVNICEHHYMLLSAATARGHKETQRHVTEQPTCSKQPGCCECSTVKKYDQNDILADELEKSNDAEFENAVQNHVFVQHCAYNTDPRRCGKFRERNRVISFDESGETVANEERNAQSTTNAVIIQLENEMPSNLRRLRRHHRRWSETHPNNLVRRSRRSITEATGNMIFKEYGNQDALEINDTVSEYMANVATAPHKLNVTTRRLVIKGLRHYTQYEIWVHACQNVSAIGGHYCSARPAWMTARTKSIPEYDLVDNSTIMVTNATGADDRYGRKITFEEPKNPNGKILAYQVNVTNEERSQSNIWECVSAEKFRTEGGITFRGLPEGTYRIEIRTLTEASLTFESTNKTSVALSLFTIVKPTFFTWRVTLLISGIIFLVLTIGSLVVYYFLRKVFGKKVREYVRQQISANPEYLSQMDVYKPDEWELCRSDIKLEEEIGRGTFGKVYRGYANNVVSHGGVRFGECAVKTVTECANSAERLHFLVEAGLMKKFNTSFIVKLYGVVSDGQPALVVMELMRKGNLRDYLRSRRPSAEENKDNLPIPTHSEYIRWAAQIADGMAYLESLKFCHRDLAARNCMVNERDWVKIGDFGMARDIYYHEYYKPTGKRLMPVRWMAPESLKDGKFTMKSDVWSYGIVLYEMLTLAQQPYSGIGTEEVFNYIGVSRRILARPTDCPDFWYNLMVHCWKYDPRERPDFSQIVEMLLEFTDEEFVEQSFVAQTAGRITYDETAVDELLQPQEIYPMANLNGPLDLVLNEDVIPGEDDEIPICNSNRRNVGSNGRRRETADVTDSLNRDSRVVKLEEDAL